MRVAVIDSGVDGGHPELRARIVGSKSFVGGSATVDTQGHGTFVAGLIAAQTDDGLGIAGLAPPAELLIAKVVGPDRSIPVEAEAKAIRWAVANGARIINMSLGGLRDPGIPAEIRTRDSKRTLLPTQSPRTSSSSPRSGMATSLPPSRGRMRAGPLLYHT